MIMSEEFRQFYSHQTFDHDDQLHINSSNGSSVQMFDPPYVNFGLSSPSSSVVLEGQKPVLETYDQHSNKGKKKKQVKETDEHGEKSFKKEVKVKKKKEKQARYAFMTKSKVDNLEDGYRWRKYGQKAVKNSPYPRSYYRCTAEKCQVKKRLERSFIDPSVVITTYEGHHNHPEPPSRGGYTAGMFDVSMPTTALLENQSFPLQFLVQNMPHHQYLYGYDGYSTSSLYFDQQQNNPTQNQHRFTDCGLLQEFPPVFPSTSLETNFHIFQ